MRCRQRPRTSTVSTLVNPIVARARRVSRDVLTVCKEKRAYPGVDGLEAILRDIRISSYSTIRRVSLPSVLRRIGAQCRLPCCGEGYEGGGAVEGSGTPDMQDVGLVEGAGGCADSPAAQLVGLDG
jgi:hypothetical protein